MIVPLPCPFCESDNLRLEMSDSAYYVCCNECGCCGPVAKDAMDPVCSDEAAVVAWNKRSCMAESCPKVKGSKNVGEKRRIDPQIKKLAEEIFPLNDFYSDEFIEIAERNMKLTNDQLLSLPEVNKLREQYYDWLADQ